MQVSQGFCRTAVFNADEAKPPDRFSLRVVGTAGLVGLSANDLFGFCDWGACEGRPEGS